MKITWVKRGLCGLLAGSLLLLTACRESAEPTAANPAEASGSQSETLYSSYSGKVKKTETVYVLMDAQGNPSSQLVTDWLHTDVANVTVSDKTDLLDLENIKSDSKPRCSGEEVIWDVDGTDLYYQGSSKKKLPVDLRIRYTLDGREIAPAELAGRSGQVTIEITMTNTDARAVSLDGKMVTMYTPVMIVGGAILPEEIFSNITVNNGSLLGDGSKQIAAFLCIPGLQQSLDLSGCGIDELEGLSFPESITIRADATNFELGNMAFLMTTDLPELDAADGKRSDLESIGSQLYELQSMQDSLADMDPDHLLRDLFTDPNTMSGAQRLTADLDYFDSMNLSMLDDLSSVVTDDNLSLFNRIRSDAQKAQLDALMSNDQAVELLAGMTQEEVTKATMLLEDVKTLQGLDVDRLTSLLGALDNTGSMTGILRQSTALSDSLTQNTQQMKTLTELMGCSTDAFALLQGVQNLTESMQSQGIALADQDVDDMVLALVRKKAAEQAAQTLNVTTQQLSLLTTDPAEWIPQDGALTADARAAAAVCLTMAQSQPGVSEEQAAQIDALLALLSSAGPVDASCIPVLCAVVGSVQPSVSARIDEAMCTAEAQSTAIAAQVKELLHRAEALNEQFAQIGMEQAQASLDYVQSLLPGLNELAGELEQNREQLGDLCILLEDEETMAYLKTASRMLVQTMDHLALNRGNLERIEKLLALTGDPAMQAFAKMLPTLQQDLKESAPVLEALTGRLDDSSVRSQLDNAPETLAALTRIAADLEANRQITDALRLAISPQNSATAASVLRKLDSLQQEDAVGGYIRLYESTDRLGKRMEAYCQLGREYRIFTLAPEDMETSVRFILKTDAIRVQQEETAENSETESAGGVVAWFKDRFGGEDDKK